MREELIRVLDVKLQDIEKNITSLTELNDKITNENEKLTYASKILELFKDGDDYNVLNFAKLSKDDFNKVLEIASNNADKVFSTDSCNYEGLVYLINGINSGVSLTLNEEQKSSIEYLIKGLSDKEEEYKAIIDGLILVKSRFPIDDIKVLNEEKESYKDIVNKIKNNNYVDDTDKICEACEFSKIGNDTKIGVLSFLLEYNADIYKNNGLHTYSENKEVQEVHEIVKDNNENTNIFKPFTAQDIKPIDFSLDDRIEIPSNNEENNSEELEIEEDDKENESLPSYDANEEITFDAPIDEQEENDEIKNEIKEDSFDGVEEYIPNQIEKEEETKDVDNDFVDVVSSGEDYEEYNLQEAKISSRELQRLFNEYGVKDIEIKDELLEGNIENYKANLDTLKSNDLINEFKKNNNLLCEIIASSSKEELENVLRIVREDLSVDDEDYEIMKKIVINTIPSIFIRDGGNYDNFIKNVEFFKEQGINLIDLFNFSKEVFVIDNEIINRNYNIVRNYNINLNYKNIKYMLILPNIAEKMDYYVESVYEDKTKNGEKFDGITYINNYAVKLNSVNDLTIKRLRYASESGNKVFGSKPNSLTGEITNLKVNALELSDSYLNGFFDNEFDGLSIEEVREYTKLIRNSSNVGNYSDELEKISKYHDGLRYVIDGINISYNKVIRNYNVLRSYGINNIKALHFAICYNLVITKEEYQKLKGFIENVGGMA